jgi:hypothetical protein
MSHVDLDSRLKEAAEDALTEETRDELLAEAMGFKVVCSLKSYGWKCKVTAKNFHDDDKEAVQEKRKHCVGIFAAPDVEVRELAHFDANDAAV